MKPPGPALRISMVAAIAVLGLIGLVMYESAERASGTEAILRMQVVDPRNLLSGNYVAIKLQEQLAPGQACPPGMSARDYTDSTPGPLQWIALAPQGDHFVAVGAGQDRTAAARFAPLVVRGRPMCTQLVGGATPASVALDLGVEAFYASQAEAQRISGVAASCLPGADCPVAAIVSIGRDGRARLKGLMVNGQRIEMAAF